MSWPLSILILALIVGLLVLAPWVGRVVASRVAEHAAPDRPRSSGYLLPSLVLSLVLLYVKQDVADVLLGGLAVQELVTPQAMLRVWKLARLSAGRRNEQQCATS
jgi:hypothetical protein